jgi:hypothetical protein
MGVSIEGAKELIRQAHAAIAEDLKENLEINRQLDLARIDGMLAVYYPQAKAGDMHVPPLRSNACSTGQSYAELGPNPIRAEATRKVF